MEINNGKTETVPRRAWHLARIAAAVLLLIAVVPKWWRLATEPISGRIDFRCLALWMLDINRHGLHRQELNLLAATVNSAGAGLVNLNSGSLSFSYATPSQFNPDGSVYFMPETIPALSVKAGDAPAPSAWVLLVATGVVCFVTQQVSAFVRQPPYH